MPDGQIVDARQLTREVADVHVPSGLACALTLVLMAPAAFAQDQGADDAPADEATDELPAKAAPKAAEPKTLPKMPVAPTPPAKPDEPVKDELLSDPRVRPLEPGQGKPRLFAPDERSGHVYIRAGTALVLPAGSIRSLVATNAVVGPGLGFVLDLGVGISRHAELDLLGTYALMSSAGGQGGGACVKCKGDHASASLGLIYHLAQGVALDPWMRFGTGYRTADYRGSSTQLDYLVPGRFHGWDIAQISLGATFFPVSSFGFGPFAEADVGTYISRPVIPTNVGGARAYGFFQLGVRVEIDPARWVKSSAPAAKRTASATPPPF